LPTIKEILADIADLGAKQLSTHEVHTRQDAFEVADKEPMPGIEYVGKRFFPQTIGVRLRSPRFQGAWAIDLVSVAGPMELADGTPGQRWTTRTFHPDEAGWPGWVQKLANASLELARWEARVTTTETEDTDGERR
jgi:hypothetical protein